MRAILLVGLCGILLGAQTPDQKAKRDNDLKALQGTWVIQTATMNGMLLGEKGGKLVFTGDRLQFIPALGNQATDTGQITLDTTQKPPRIKHNVANARIGNAAYELNGDTLKIAIANMNMPITDVTDAGKILWTLKRVKP